MLREMFGYSTLEKEAGSVWTKWLEAITLRVCAARVTKAMD
jgi:hypothetical protein